MSATFFNLRRREAALKAEQEAAQEAAQEVAQEVKQEPAKPQRKRAPRKG